VTKTGYELLSRWPIDEIIECPYWPIYKWGQDKRKAFASSKLSGSGHALARRMNSSEGVVDSRLQAVGLLQGYFIRTEMDQNKEVGARQF